MIGFIGLIFSADKFTDNSAKIANLWHISPLVIGIVVLGFGTSAPEMIVSSLASFNNNPAVGVGNALGSNITNIALILGITALVKPIYVADNILKKEWIILLIATFLAWFLVWDGFLSRLDGLILLTSLFLFLLFIIKKSHSKHQNIQLEADAIIKVDKKDKFKIWGYLILSLLVLLGSAQLSVFGAVSIAKIWGVSDLVIGLTVVALGTSLPELSVSISAVLKKQDDLIVGNVIGSNLFNTLAVLAMPAVITPSSISPLLNTRDFPILLGLTLLLFLVAYSFSKKHIINRFEGFILLSVYVLYINLLF